nr:MAG TPA: replisome organizer [Caudoviricetes sp.]
MARRGYVQLVNGFYANEKVQELARSGRMDAVGAFCMALTYCGDHLTDGFVPRRAMLYVIGATGEQVNALCDVGMLEAVDEGWLIHDYTAHNRTKEQVLHARRKSAERVAKHRNESDVTALHRNCNAVTSGQTPEHQNTRTPKKEKEEYSSSFSKEIGVSDFELVREKAHANADIIRNYPNLDLSDAWNAFNSRHYGETRSVSDWTRLWKGWCQRRANMSGIPPSKRHIHTWQCEHVLQALGRDKETATPDQQACQMAKQLNKEENAK